MTPKQAGAWAGTAVAISAAWVTVSETLLDRPAVEVPMDLWEAGSRFFTAHAVPLLFFVLGVVVLGIMGLKWALRHGLIINASEPTPMDASTPLPAPSATGNERREGPVEAYIVSRFILENVVDAAVKKSVNGDIAAVKRSVEELRTESREATTKVHERIDALTNALLVAGK